MPQSQTEWHSMVCMLQRCSLLLPPPFPSLSPTPQYQVAQHDPLKLLVPLPYPHPPSPYLHSPPSTLSSTHTHTRWRSVICCSRALCAAVTASPPPISRRDGQSDETTLPPSAATL